MHHTQKNIMTRKKMSKGKGHFRPCHSIVIQSLCSRRIQFARQCNEYFKGN